MWLLNTLLRLRFRFPVYLAPDRSQWTNSDFIQEDYTKAFEESPTPVEETFPEPEPYIEPYTQPDERPTQQILDGKYGPYDGRPRDGHGVLIFGPADFSAYDKPTGAPPTGKPVVTKPAARQKSTAPWRNARGQFVKRRG